MTTDLATTKTRLKKVLHGEQFTEILTKLAANHIRPETIAEKAYFAISKNPALLACTDESLLRAIVTSAILGLDCVGTLGQGYLVPYGKECTFIAGYQGLIELARRSGHVIRIEARVVHEKDGFEVIFGLDQMLKHVPALVADPGKIVCVYAMADLKGGGQQIEVMRADEIEAIRNRSKAKDSGPWKTDYSEMARKTAVRRLIKYIPKSPELIEAVEADDEQYDFNAPRGRRIESQEVPVTDRIKGQFVKPEEEPPAPEETKKEKTKSPPKPPAKTEQAEYTAGPVDQEPAPPQVEDASPTELEPETEAPAKYKCKRCKRTFAELNDKGKCPYCVGECEEL